MVCIFKEASNMYNLMYINAVLPLRRQFAFMMRSI